MKLDKDTVVKHQFWFLLGGYLFVWLIAVMWLKVAAGEPIETAQKNYKDRATALDGAQKNPVNVATFLPPWNKVAKEFNDHKSVIWGQAWEHQEGMYDWPPDWSNKDMTTPQAMLTDDNRYDYKEKWYPNQIEALRKSAPLWLAPIELAGGFDQVFGPQKWPSTPTREEIWLAQEDFWVKRELFVDIYKTMYALAAMPPPPEFDGQKDKPAGVEARYRFANQSWEITLHLRRQDGKKDGPLIIGGDSTIRNTDPNHRPQPLTNAKGEGIGFNIAQDQIRTGFVVRGEPVGWNETRPFSMSKDGERKDYDPLDGIVWDKIDKSPVFVSQAFDVTNSPIRRLDALAVAKQDCRTYTWLLHPNQELEHLDASADDSDPSKKGPSPAGPGPGGPGGGMMPGGGGPGGGGAAASAMSRSGGPGGGPGPPGLGGRASAPVGNLTPNNSIDRDRYLRPSNQDKKYNPPSRHLPLALRLVVEQSHIHDVQLALANSRLRIQITQVEIQHNKDYVPPTEGDKKDDSATGMGGRTFNGGYMPNYGGMPSGGARGSMGMGPGGPRGSMGMGPGGPRGSMGMGSGGPRGSMGGGAPMMSPPMGGAPGGRGRFARSPGAPPMGRPGAPPGMGGPETKSSGQNQHDDNLVDITIYGIATLYRHPDPPKTTTQPGQAAQPGQPAGPAGKTPPSTAPTSGATTTPPPKSTAEPSGATTTPPPKSTAEPSGKQPAPAPPAPAPKGKKS